MTEGLECLPEAFGLFNGSEREGLYVRKLILAAARKMAGEAKPEAHKVQVGDDGPELRKERVDGEKGAPRGTFE